MLLLRLYCPKSLYLLEGRKVSIISFVSVFFGMDKCISLTMSLGGWMASCLRQKLLKPCCILVKKLPNVHLIKLIILIVIDPMDLQVISVSSWVVKSMTAKQCRVCCDKTSWTLSGLTHSFIPPCPWFAGPAFPGTGGITLTGPRFSFNPCYP